jgi:acyl-CoA thioester hydrolase
MSDANRTFRHFVRVPYAHTDQMGFVYYANYLVYFEMARAEMLREVGLPYAELEKQGVFLPVVEAHCEYKSPAHFDDRLEISTNCRILGVRLRVEYNVSRGSELIVTGHTVHAGVSAALKIMRPPQSLQKLITPSNVENLT